MTTTPLTVQDQALTGFTHVVKITYADLTDTAALTKTIAIVPESGTNAIGAYVLRAGFQLKTSFTGGATTALTLQVGDGGDTDRFIPAKSLHADATPVTNWITANATDTLPYAYVAADTIDALFTATDANLTALTAGEVWVFLQVGGLSNVG